MTSAVHTCTTHPALYLAIHELDMSWNNNYMISIISSNNIIINVVVVVAFILGILNYDTCTSTLQLWFAGTQFLHPQ